jgi:hypothetical protein
MFRKLIQFLPFLLPFVAWGLYMVLARSRARSKQTGQPAWQDTPWAWLTIAGLVLFIAGMIGVALMEEGNTEGTYIPPRLEDGRIVPSDVR